MGPVDGSTDLRAALVATDPRLPLLRRLIQATTIPDEWRDHGR